MKTLSSKKTKALAIFGVKAIVIAIAIAGGAVTAHAQDIAQIAKSDPLIITGAVGTNNTFYHSSMGSSFATPFSSTFYASMNISVYGFSTFLLWKQHDATGGHWKWKRKQQE